MAELESKYEWNQDTIDHFKLTSAYTSKGDVIRDYFLNYKTHSHDITISLSRDSITYHNSHEEMDWEVTLAETGLDSMTGARVKRIQKYINEEMFLLTYGDGLGDVNLKQLHKFHQYHGKIMTVTGVRPPGRFGELMKNADGHVIEFNEKPQATGGMISGGFFLCRKEIFDYLNDDVNLVFEKEPMENLVRDRQLMVFDHDGFWQPMDTYREYTLLNRLYSEGVAPWIR